MPPYIDLTKALEAASGEVRRDEKAELLAHLLKDLPPEMIRPVVRLISGRLWPPWEPREMGIGPETLGDVLEELSSHVTFERGRRPDLGDLAETMVLSRSQQTLIPATMDSVFVYDSLRQISAQKGPGSLFRKKAILKGLFLNATPIEAKYIARAVLGRTAAGLGPSLISAAIGRAFSIDEAVVKRAYARLPDFGMVALNALRGEIFEVKLAPPNPVRPMPLEREKTPDEAIKRSGLAAYVVWYGGLRVQVHKLNGQVFVYSNRLRNVTLPLSDLAEVVMMVRGNYIMEGELILVQQGKISPLPETVARINLKGRSRDSAIPTFAASDLLYLNGEELIDKGYAERRRALRKALRGVAGGILSSRVFLAQEKVIGDPDKAKDLFRWSLDQGYRGLVLRDLEGTYTPGSKSRLDVVISQMPET